MKKILLILKILVILVLLLINVLILYLSPYIVKYKPMNDNFNNIITTNKLYTDTDNKMTLFYFSTPSTNNKIKEERLSELINNTACSKVVNFIKYEIVNTDIENYLIYETITKNQGPDTVVLLDRLGKEIISFDSNTSIETIEKELKEILKNYL